MIYLPWLPHPRDRQAACPTTIILNRPIMNRRDFLRAAPGVARSAGHVLAALDEVTQLVSSPCADPDLALLRMARRAMATTFEVLVPYGTPDALALGEAALDRIDELEAQLTVYRDSSEVSRLNRMAAYQAIPVEDGLFGLLDLAARINRDTDGAFDVTAGALSKAWGFYRGPRQGAFGRRACRGFAARRHAARGAGQRPAHRALPAPGVGDQPGQHRQGPCARSRRGDAGRRGYAGLSLAWRPEQRVCSWKPPR